MISDPFFLIPCTGYNFTGHNVQIYLILHFNQPGFIRVQKGFKFIGDVIADDTLVVTSCKTSFCIFS